MSDRELHLWLVNNYTNGRAGSTTMSATERAVDGLVKQGLVADTGQRGRWTHKGREIIWRLVEDQEQTG